MSPGAIWIIGYWFRLQPAGPLGWRGRGAMRGHRQIGRYSFFMDSHALLVRAVATLARRQIALEALLQGKGISKENIAEAAGPQRSPQNRPLMVTSKPANGETQDRTFLADQ